MEPPPATAGILIFLGASAVFASRGRYRGLTLLSALDERMKDGRMFLFFNSPVRDSSRRAAGRIKEVGYIQRDRRPGRLQIETPEPGLQPNGWAEQRRTGGRYSQGTLGTCTGAITVYTILRPSRKKASNVYIFLT